MELVSIALAMSLSPRWRREFRRAGFYIMLLVAVGRRFAAGVLERQPRLDHAEPPPRPRPVGRGVRQAAAWSSSIFWGARGVYSPLVFLGVLVAIGAGDGSVPAPGRLPCGCREDAAYPEIALRLAGAEKARFLLAFGLPLLAMYTVLSPSKPPGEPNWTAPGFVSLSVLAAALWHDARTNAQPCCSRLSASTALGDRDC